MLAFLFFEGEAEGLERSSCPDGAAQDAAPSHNKYKPAYAGFFIYSPCKFFKIHVSAPRIGYYWAYFDGEF